MFRAVSLSIIRSLALYTQQKVQVIQVMLTACQQAVSIQRYCLKHVESYSENKFEKLVLLVSFIIRIYHGAWSSECQRYMVLLGFLGGAFIVSFFERHFEKSIFSGFHGYNPQARKLCITEHSKECFFRAPTRTGVDHFWFNILSGLCLCHSSCAVVPVPLQLCCCACATLALLLCLCHSRSVLPVPLQICCCACATPDLLLCLCHSHSAVLPVPLYLCCFACVTLDLLLCLCHSRSAVVPVPLSLCCCACATLDLLFCLCHSSSAVVPVQLSLCCFACATLALLLCLCHSSSAVVPVPLQLCCYACATLALLLCLCHSSSAVLPVPLQICCCACATPALLLCLCQHQLCCFPTQFQWSYICSIQGVEKSCGVYVGRDQDYAQLRADFTLLIWQVGAASVDEKDNITSLYTFQDMECKHF